MLPKGVSYRAACAVGGVIFLNLLFIFIYVFGSPASPPPTREASHPASDESEVAPPRNILDDIYNSTLGFGDILVVSLPRRTDRRDGMHLQSSLSNFHINFVDGVNGDDIPDKAIPQTSKHGRLGGGAVGSWRGHMNAIQQIVDRNLSSALIFEDDIDWDVRIHEQLYDFALSAHALIQPLAGTSNQYADPTFPRPGKNSPDSVPDLYLNKLPKTETPTISPYGDDWDVLWIGHCGMHFPFKDDAAQPKGRVVHSNDETVARKKHLLNIPQPFTLVDDYPQHTRVVHHAEEGVCTLGYAVSLNGARKLIYELGLKDVTDQFDILLRFFCNGGKGRKPHRCLAVQPSFFHHYHAKGPKSSASDLQAFNKDEFIDTESTDMVRWSVRLNAETIMNGGTVYQDQYPD